MKFNIIGAGRLGKHIGAALSTHGLGHLHAVCNRSLESAHTACENIGAGMAVETLHTLPPADITFLTCNDDAIAPIAHTLSQSTVLQPQSIVVHCSGVLGSDILAPLKAQGHAIASLHPLKAFGLKWDALAFDGVDCILEGDNTAIDFLTPLFIQLNATIIPIRPEAKAAYHAGACMASNYLITLASAASQLFVAAGISSQQAQDMICKLMQSNLYNLQEVSELKHALTGPLMRGDTTTIALHLEAIKHTDVAALYQSAGLATLGMTSLDSEQKSKLVALLA